MISDNLPAEELAKAAEARANLAGEVLGMMRSPKLAKRIGELRPTDYNTLYTLRTLLMSLMREEGK